MPSKKKKKRVFEKDGAQFLIDEESLEHLYGSTLHYARDLMRQSFVIVNNPHAENSCGCGTSFNLRQ